MPANFTNVEEWAVTYDDALNSFGCDGWEFIEEMAGHGVFKRPIEGVAWPPFDEYAKAMGKLEKDQECPCGCGFTKDDLECYE